MSYPIHYVPAGDVLPIFFSTYGKTNGESLTMTGLAVTDIEIYKDGSTTQRSSDAGYVLLDTDGIDFDSLTGIHGFSIDTGDNTDSGFYTVGAWFHVVVSAVTVDSQTVSFIAAAFRLMPAEGVAGAPKTDVHAVNGSTTGVDKLAAHLPAVLKGLTTSGSTTTTVVANATTGIDGGVPSSTNDFYNGRVIVFTSGALAGQATSITDYVGSTQTFTVVALTGSPASGVTFVIV